MKTLSLVILCFILTIITAWSQNVKNGGEQPLLTIDSDDFSELKFLDEILQNKRIVFLGESQHGINDFSVLKFRMIRYLREYHNFEVVAFESGIANCGLTNLAKDSLNGMEMLAHSLLGVWRVKGNCEMMDYIRNKDMEIAGIDPNNNALYLNAKRRNYFLDDSSLSKEFAALDSIKLYKYDFTRSDWYYQNIEFSEKRIDSLSDQLSARYLELKNQVALKQDLNETQKKIINKAIESIVRELNKGNDKEKPDYFIDGSTREKLMAQNLEYMLEDLYPDKKIIVWAHNGHIAKEGPNINGKISIGSYLPDRLKKLSYVIGLYATDGEFSWGMNQPQKITTKEGSFENIYSGFESKALFVPITMIKSTNYYHGIPEGIDNITKLYDAVMFVKDVKASSLVRFNKEFICK